LGDEIKEDKMGIGEKRNAYRFWWGEWKERDKLEDIC
jgi:hypothetical protein